MKYPSKRNTGEKCEFFCNLSGKKMPLPHFWEHPVGSGHATLALRVDWRRQLRHCHEELGFRHVRFHGILCDDVGTLVEEQGKRLYSFFNLDQIFDFLLSIGMKPFVELSFMPKTLSSDKTTVFHYNANVTPPAEWDELIDKLAAHLVQRYGATGLHDWFFEVWNDPDNVESFNWLKERWVDVLKNAGHAATLVPLHAYFKKQIPIEGVGHQNGTRRMGTDPLASVLDPKCKSHDLDNLYGADASCFVSASAVNPSLTVIANAIRVAGHIVQERFT